MQNALNYFCTLTEEDKEEFMTCPQVSGDAESFFSLAKAIGCSKKEDLTEYLTGCNFVCQSIKAQAIYNSNAAETASLSYFEDEEEKYDEERVYWEDTATILSELSTGFTEYKETQMGNDPEAVKTAFNAQIDATTLTDDEKTTLKNKVASTLDGKTDFDGITYTSIQSSLKAEIVSATASAATATTNKAATTSKKNQLSEYYSEVKT